MKISVSDIIFYPLVAAGLILAVTEFIPSVWYIVNDFKHLARYQWLFYGMIAYFVIRRFHFFKKNESWLQTFAHELSHTLVSMLFLRKIYGFRADERSGVMYHDQVRFGDIFIGLAPYCLPYITYLFLILRLIGSAKMFFVFDLLIGFTYAFHLMCYKEQTGTYQTDLQRQGITRSYLFIAFFRLFNATIILLSIRFGLWKAVVRLFTEYWDNLVGWFGMLFG